MSSTNPPNPNVSTFNNLYWSITDIPLTQSQADRRYLKFPVAQGKETLQDIDVNGVANFNQPITMTSATAANRSISSSIYNVKNASNSSIGNITYTSNSINYQSSISNARHLFTNNTGGTNIDVMEITANNGVVINKPLAMNGASSADRAITTTNLNINNDTNTAVGTISGSTNSIFYDNNVNSGTHTFYANNSSGTQINPLNISSSSINANKPLILAGGSSTDRAVTTTLLNLHNETNSAIGILTALATNIIYDNNTNNGNHQFRVQSSGNEFTPVTINPSGLILNTSGNYIQFPDGTQQTTAALGKTYSILYRPTTTISQFEQINVTIPAKCYSIDIHCWGSGGLAGTAEETGTAYNGTGGGGSQGKSSMSVFPGGTIEIIFQSNDNAGNFGFTRVRVASPTNYIPIVAYNGGSGGNASGSTPGNAPNAGTRTAVTTSTFSTPWWIAANTVGFVGTVGTPPVLAGAPSGHSYQTGGIGVGAIRFQKPLNALINGAVLLTYNIAN